MSCVVILMWNGFVPGSSRFESLAARCNAAEKSSRCGGAAAPRVRKQPETRAVRKTQHTHAVRTASIYQACYGATSEPFVIVRQAGFVEACSLTEALLSLRCGLVA